MLIDCMEHPRVYAVAELKTRINGGLYQTRRYRKMLKKTTLTVGKLHEAFEMLHWWQAYLGVQRQLLVCLRTKIG